MTYQNSGFYDPVRAEHAEVCLDFSAIGCPLDRDSSRAWRFYWDPLFFEICRASGSALSFDLDTYRELDVTGRRLYLLLKKMFWRCETTLPFDLRHLAVNVLGFTPDQPPWRLKARTQNCVERLVEHGILALPAGGSIKSLFRKQATGRYTIVFQRGPQFDRSVKTAAQDRRFTVLRTAGMIGFDRPSIARILRSYSAKLVGEWADITLAARERQRRGVLQERPTKHTSSITYAMPPRATARRPTGGVSCVRRKNARDPIECRRFRGGARLLLGDRGTGGVSRVTDRIFGELSQANMDEAEARYCARYIARQNLKAQFYREHPECRPAEPDAQPIRHNAEDE